MNFTPVLITLAAGLATVIGALVVGDRRHPKAESLSLAFATGLMLAIALADLLPESAESLGWLPAMGCTLGGICVSVLLDVLFPHHHDHAGHADGHHHEEKEPGHYITECECTHSATLPSGMIVALVLHNIVEGLATGVIAENDLHMGVSMAIGIALHNIPIGATLAVSVISSGRKKGAAVLVAALVAVSQPVGALVGALSIIGEGALDVCTALVSGIILFIAFDELWPAARRNGSRALNIVAFLIGAAIVIFL